MLKWTPDESQFGGMGVKVAPPSDAADAPPPLFTAIQEQIGLKLHAGKAQVEVLALDHFASGLRLNGVDNQAQLHATIDAAVRAGVSFWPVDARGLVAQAPLGDATQGSPGNAGLYSGTAAQATTDKFQQSQDTMYALAADTGGTRPNIESRSGKVPSCWCVDSSNRAQWAIGESSIAASRASLR